MDTTKDINTEEKHPTVSHKIFEPVSYFNKDANFVFVFKKTEKLATAVYLVTNLLSDNEPMKWTLRKKVSDLLSYTIGYKNVSDSGRLDFSLVVKTYVLEIVSLLEIGARSGFVSDMNVTVLKQEFSNLILALDTSHSSPKNAMTSVISESFFDISESENLPIKDMYIPRHFASPVVPTEREMSKSRRSIVPTEKIVFKRNNRQNIIINLLKKKKEINIKDVTEIIQDCSEKTVQRELIALTFAGLIKKTGDRRWSRYSLVADSVL